jgi:hypothetical protein
LLLCYLGSGRKRVSLDLSTISHSPYIVDSLDLQVLINDNATLPGLGPSELANQRARAYSSTPHNDTAWLYGTIAKNNFLLFHFGDRVVCKKLHALLLQRLHCLIDQSSIKGAQDSVTSLKKGDLDFLMREVGVVTSEIFTEEIGNLGRKFHASRTTTDDNELQQTVSLLRGDIRDGRLLKVLQCKFERW